MNLEHICYGCFQEKPDDSPVCPHCGFNAEEEQPFLALPMGALLNGRYMTGKVLGVGGFGITYLGYDLTLEIKGPGGLSKRHGALFRGSADPCQTAEYAEHRVGAELF